MGYDVTRAELEQLSLRSIVALGYVEVRRVRHEFIVPPHVPNPRKYHKAVDADLEFVRQFAAGAVINLEFATRRMRISFDAAQAGHDMIYAHGPHAFQGQLALANAVPETRRAAFVGEAISHASAAVYHFSFAVLSATNPEAVRSAHFPIDQPGGLDKAFRRSEPLRGDYEQLLTTTTDRCPALGEPVDVERLLGQV